MKLDIISVVVMVFCLCVCITLAAEATTFFRAKTVEVAVVSAR